MKVLPRLTREQRRRALAEAVNELQKLRDDYAAVFTETMRPEPSDLARLAHADSVLADARQALAAEFPDDGAPPRFTN